MKNTSLNEELDRMKFLAGVTNGLLKEEDDNGWIKFYQDDKFLVMKKPFKDFVEQYIYFVIKFKSDMDILLKKVVGDFTFGEVTDSTNKLKQSNLPQYIKTIIKNDVSKNGLLEKNVDKDIDVQSLPQGAPKTNNAPHSSGPPGSV